MTWRTAVEDLRARAERCLASAAPTAAEAHELAAVSLEVLGSLERLERDAARGGSLDPAAAPYRMRSQAHEVAPEGDESTRAVSLERALEECQLRLHEALTMLASLELRAAQDGSEYKPAKR